jgi:hypothetical protein
MPRGVRKRICQERRATPRRLIAMPLKGKVEAPMETPFSIAGHHSDHAAECRVGRSKLFPSMLIVAAHSKKLDLDPVQKEVNMGSTGFDNISDNLRKLLSTPLLMKGEDPDVYAELYGRVEEVAQPKDVWDQMRSFASSRSFDEGLKERT